jgi:hypothetical protein
MTLFVPLISVAGAAVVAYLTALLTWRSKRDEAAISFKEEKYAKLLVRLQGFVGTTASTELKREFFEEQYQAWLYASDQVVNALNELVALIVEANGDVPDPELGRKAIGNAVLEMRRDLMGYTSLDHSAFRYTDVYPNRRPVRGSRQ